jgi:transposase
LSGLKNLIKSFSISFIRPSDLAFLLLLTMLITSTRNNYFMRYYTNQLKGRERERGIKTEMKVKLAAKMLIIAWTLMKNKEPFDPAYLNIE